MSSKSTAEEELETCFQSWKFRPTIIGKKPDSPENHKHHGPVSEQMPDSSTSGWSSLAWGWVSSKAAAVWGAGSGAVASTKAKLSQLRDQDPLEVAKKPEVQAWATDAGNLVRAVMDPNGITEVVKTAVNVATKYVNPESVDNKVVAGTINVATLFGNFCGPYCAMFGAGAVALYAYLYHHQDDGSAPAGRDGDDHEAEDKPTEDCDEDGAKQEAEAKLTSKL